MRIAASRGEAMKHLLRLGLIGIVAAAGSFALPHAALAQNTDDAHAFCAQGGGEDPGAGAGGAIVPPGSTDVFNGAGQSGTDDGAGPGGGGAGGGLAGSDDGGGAGGCAPEETPAPVPVQVVLRTRHLPTTGS